MTPGRGGNVLRAMWQRCYVQARRKLGSRPSMFDTGRQIFLTLFENNNSKLLPSQPRRNHPPQERKQVLKRRQTRHTTLNHLYRPCGDNTSCREATCTRRCDSTASGTKNHTHTHTNRCAMVVALARYILYQVKENVSRGRLSAIPGFPPTHHHYY